MLLLGTIRLENMEAEQAFRIGRAVVALGDFGTSGEQC